MGLIGAGMEERGRKRETEGKMRHGRKERKRRNKRRGREKDAEGEMEIK